MSYDDAKKELYKYDKDKIKRYIKDKNQSSGKKRRKKKI
jgi:hypothetical protein